jgi:4-hydroxy-3-methylbut-2-enyl diphosphate reductase
MKVTIEPASGFCSGVRKAVSKAEKELEVNKTLYSLGDIVHNETETGRLENIGLKSITHQDFAGLQNEVVLIRAHGEPPETFETAKKNGIKLIDATCPVVRRIQNDIGETFLSGRNQGVQIAIFGKKNHPEVNGLAGQCEGKAIIINEEEDLFQLDFSRPIVLYSQTTMNPMQYLLIQDAIRTSIRQSNPTLEEHFKIKDTICRQVSRLAGIFKNFASQHQMIIFVSGKESSNGRYLYGLCREVNLQTHLVTSVEDIQNEWFRDVSDVGICGATSTPVWLLKEIGFYIETHY